MPGTPWPRPVLISVLVAGALAWGLLSILMVVWGWRGVVLTAAVVLLVAAVGAYRSRYR